MSTKGVGLIIITTDCLRPDGSLTVVSSDNERLQSHHAI